MGLPQNQPAHPTTHPLTQNPPTPQIGGGGGSVLSQSATNTKTLCICQKQLLCFRHYAISEQQYS